MSSTTAAAPPAGTTIESNTTSGSTGPSSALYLYTFLSTLVILVVISAAVITRSIILRRRHREHIARALADGTFRPDMLRRGDSLWRIPGVAAAMVRPVMYEVSIPVGEKEALKDKNIEAGLFGIAPLSAKVLYPTSSAPSLPPTPPSRSTPLNQRAHTSRLGRYFFPQARPSSTNPPPPQSPPLSSSSTEETIDGPTPALSFSVLIAMPDPGSKPAPPGESAEPPYFELGVVAGPISGATALAATNTATTSTNGGGAV